jgi:1,4-alpha-glucan branching enzyme
MTNATTQTIRARFPWAEEVCIVGEFNNWSTTATPMLHIGAGMWEVQVAAAGKLHDICFFVFERGRRLGRLVRLGRKAEVLREAR